MAAAIVIHGLADAAAALAPGRPVVLLSAPGAAGFAGVGWWRALVAAGRAAHPATPCTDVLDCADAAGRALEALRAGQRCLILEADAPGFADLAAIARAEGAVLLTARPAALDLADPGARRRIAAWLDDKPAAPG